MGIRKYDLTIPLPKATTFDLLIEAGCQLPTSSELAGIQFGRWENTLADPNSGRLEWKMYDHKYASIILRAALMEKSESETQASLEVERKGQYLDPLGLFKKTLLLLLDPFLDRVKQHIQSSLESQPGSITRDTDHPPR